MINSHAMHCTLLVPHLFWPREYADAAYRDLALEPMQTFLSRADNAAYPAISFEGWLCQAYQVERQQDWPVAPLTLALDGADAGESYWLRADPVHLQLGRKQVLLMEGRMLGIAQEEADALVAALNSHFGSQGLAFQAAQPERWYVRTNPPPQLITHTLSESAGEDVHERLPSGADAMVWHRLFNEVQMLFHPHAVNEAREAARKMTINSVWFWGGGISPRVQAKPYDAVWSNDALATALAVRADTHTVALPRDATAWLSGLKPFPANTRHLIVADELSSTTAYRDVSRWRERIASFNSTWIAPLVEALKDSRLARFTLVAPGSEACWRFEASRGTLMKLWRRPRSLHHYS